MTGALAAAGGNAVIDYSGFATETLSGTAPAFYTMKGNGSILKTGDETGNLKWVRNKAPTNHEVYATVTSGSLSSGLTGAWIDFTADRTWQKDAPPSATVQLQLRDKYSLSVIKTVSITLEPVV